jgi:hypothetical protein
VEAVKKGGPLLWVDAGSIVLYGKTDSVTLSPHGDPHDAVVPGIATGVVHQDRR